MRIARVRTPEGRTFHAVVEGKLVRPVEGDLFGTWKAGAESISLDEVKLLAPLIPVNMLCFGRNYKAHAEEGGEDLPKEPLLFIKSSSCVIDPGDAIVVPEGITSQVDYESELAVIIGKRTRNVSRKDALASVLGYTCANDVSARDVQGSDGQWARAKSFDTFGPLGPWIETDLDPASLRIQGRLNGRPMQDSSTSLLIFDVAYLISFLSRGMTLLPGTVILTGTPSGCGFAQEPPRWLMPGDSFEVEIEGIGTLMNRVETAGEN